MTHDFISLAIIAAIAALAPLIANLIPKKPVPETVLLLLGGAILGPHLVNVIWLDESAELLSDLGCGMLFLLAGYEINPKTITGREGKRGLATWAVSLALAFVAVHAFTGVQARGLDGLAVTIALTTTAIGALMPILKERGLMDTRVGSSILSYGTWGELGPVIAMALLLSTRATWLTVVILLGFIVVAVLVARFGHRTARADGLIRDILFAGRDTTSQTFVRLTVALLILLVAISSLFDLDIVLGAFAAGFILRYIIPKDDEILEKKLNAIGYGFLIPLFFVVSGAKIDLSAVAAQPALLVGFIAMLVLIRAVPIFVSMARDKDPEVDAMGARNHATVAVYCTTALPLIVAVTSVAVNGGAMDASTASVFVSAGAVTMLLMPLIASLTYRAANTRAVKWLEKENR
ncbi:cation:proton antiporter [uncultured Slackia sp.]|uniref:cation:proton antiporter n=1 Tax=uncultured Slackia sp. TaxID=665903 RepID=UPI0025D59E6D|nr:cation:proton antiporter [uncultured Slackia sp.]